MSDQQLLDSPWPLLVVVFIIAAAVCICNRGWPWGGGES